MGTVDIHDIVLAINDEPVNTFHAADRFTETTAWAPATIRWGTEDSLDAPRAATLALRLTIPEGERIPSWGDKVALSFMDGESPTPYGLFSGRIDRAARRPLTMTDPTGTKHAMTEYDLEASDEIATLARTRLADDPWPEEIAERRWDRLRDLADDAGVHLGIVDVGNNDMRARDVDSYPALDAVTLTMAHLPWLLTCDQFEVRGAEITAPQVIMIDDQENVWTTDDEFNVVPVPPAALFDGDRSLDDSSVVTSVMVRHPETDPDDADKYIDRRTTFDRPATARMFGPSSHTIETDLTGNLTPAYERAKRILAARSRAIWSLPDPMGVLLDRLDTTAGMARMLFAEQWRTGRVIRIEDTPEDMTAYHRINGGTLTLGPTTEDTDLEITTEPAEYLAARTVTIMQMDQFPIETVDEHTFADFRLIGDARKDD